MTRFQEPLKRLPSLEEEQRNHIATSLSDTHNVYFIEGSLADASKPLKKFRGYLAVFPRVGEIVQVLSAAFKVKEVRHHLKLSNKARPDIFVILEKYE